MKKQSKELANRPVDELKKLAVGIQKGQVFTDRHVGNLRDLGMVFWPLLFMDEKTRKNHAKMKPEMVYEWIDKAGPRCCNGMPMFMSCGLLNKHDAELVWKMVDALNESEKKTLEAIK